MIRINLLRPPEAPGVGEAPSGVGLTQREQVQFLVGGLAAALLVAGACYWYWNGQVSKLTNDLAVEKREAARLAAIQAENQRYVQQLREIDTRLRTIQTLQDRRVGPTALLSALGETVNQTPGVYLLTAGAETGRLVIQGQSDSVNAIADFVAALKRAGPFQDVQLRQFFQEDQDNRTSFKFNLDCALVSPGAAAPPPATSAVPTAAKPARSTRPIL
jgi:Tfp pilus assembly protein PilN